MFVVGCPGFFGEVLIVTSRERKVVESSNLLKLVLDLSKNFEEKPSKIFFDLNALLNFQNKGTSDSGAIEVLQDSPLFATDSFEPEPKV